MIQETEARIEKRLTLETVAQRVPVVAELVAEHAAAVEACRLAADAFRTSNLTIDANPSDVGAQAAAGDLRRAIDAVRGIAERYA